MSEIDVAWFDLNEKRFSLHDAIFGTLDAIKQFDSTRIEAWKEFLSVYTGRQIPGDLVPWDLPSPEMNPQMSYNATAQAIDTIVSRVTAQDPAPYFLTRYGTEQKQRAAETFQAFTNGVFWLTDAWDEIHSALLDAAMLGIGHVIVLDAPQKVTVDRCTPGSVWVDPLTGKRADGYFFERYVSRQDLIELYPDHEKKLLLTSGHPISLPVVHTVPDLIRVVECWQRNKRHVVCVENCTLVDEKWGEHLPIKPIRISDPVPYGYWQSIGLVEACLPIQNEIDFVAKQLQNNHECCAVPTIVTSEKAEVPFEHVATNQPVRVLRSKSGIPFEVINPRFADQQQFQYQEGLYQKLFERALISLLSAHGQKPPGLNSGVALRNWHDIESIGLSRVAKRLERFVGEVAEEVVRAGRRVYKGYGDWSVKVPSKKMFKDLKWSEAAMKKDEFMIQVRPVSKMPMTVSAKLEHVTYLKNEGFISPQEGREILDMPDTEREEELGNAPVNYLKDGLERMAEEPGYRLVPTIFFDLSLAQKLAGAYYCKLAQQEADPKILEKYEDFALDCRRMEEKMQQAMMQMQQQMMAQQQPQPPPQEQQQ